MTGRETLTAAQTLEQSPQAPTPMLIVLSSPTPVFTSTSVFNMQISVSTPTKCRTGPGIAYDRVGGLQVGEVVEVVGRNATGNYWIIRNPDRPGQRCWLWGEFATVTGNTSALPVYTPPPTPTPLPAAKESRHLRDLLCLLSGAFTHPDDTHDMNSGMDSPMLYVSRGLLSQ